MGLQCLRRRRSLKTHKKTSQIHSDWKFQRHESSTTHQKNFETKGDATLPPTHMFADMFKAFQKQTSVLNVSTTLQSGCIVGREKASKLLWCLHEAHLEQCRQLIRSAECMVISRDERHGRLQIRWRCIQNDTVSSGTLALCIGYKPDALVIEQATEQKFK